MNSFAQLWNNICNHLIEHKYMSDTAFELWISPLKFVKFDEVSDTIYLTISEEYKKNIVISKFLDKLEQAAEEIIGFSINIKIFLDDEVIIEEEPEDSSSESKKLEPRFTFENFIQGDSNRFAYAAAKAVAENPGKKYNPLFIYGPSGVGKTHLMNAIVNEIRKNHPNVKIELYTSEAFMNEFISCIRSQTNQAFRDKYRNCDILLLDDIQFLSGKEGTIDEFFHTFNALTEKGKQIILTSDVKPRDLKNLPDRLVSRFEAGFIADIGNPDTETRAAIIQQKAKDLNLEISSSTSIYIAEKVHRNIRQIEGVVQKLKAYSDLTGNSITQSVAQSFIDELSTENKPIETRIETIINEVSKVYGVSPADIKSDRRTSSIVLARQVAIYITSKTTTLTQTEIGSFFGGKDHSTIIYAINKLKTRMDEDHSIKSTVNDIISNLED